MAVKKTDNRKTMKEQLESIKHLVRPHVEQAPKKRKTTKKPE